MTARSRVLDYLMLAVGLLVAWYALFRWAGPDALSPPIPTFERVASFLGSATFWDHAAATGIAFLYACVIALAGGLLIGCALGFHRFAGQVGEPILTTLYSVPKITLYPVILLIFGLGISAKVAFGALHGIFPVALFTIGAIKNTSPVLRKTARMLRLSPVESVRTVLLPAALPEIVTGLRVGFATTLLGTLIGELFASDRGVGFILVRAMEAHRVTDIMALTLLLFAFAAGANALLLAVEHKIHRRGAGFILEAEESGNEPSQSPLPDEPRRPAGDARDAAEPGRAVDAVGENGLRHRHRHDGGAPREGLSLAPAQARLRAVELHSRRRDLVLHR
jgi:NitT/TauT family transport system permease protein